jgi:hypothetical protein
MENLIEKYKDRLPKTYLDFLSKNQSFEGNLKEEFGYVALWDTKALHEAWGGYKFQDFLGDEWFPIGSNGGGEIIAIKINSLIQGLFYIPFIPMLAEYATPYCDDFAKLYNTIEHITR